MSKSANPTSKSSPDFRSWLLAFRPKTLTAAVVPVLVGTAVAARDMSGLIAPVRTPGLAAEMHFGLAALAVLSSLLIQIATNLINDALDFKKGSDTEKRLGPKRVSASGLISPSRVLLGGYVFFALAVLAAIPLMISGGPAIVLIGVASIACGYLYTGGPFPLAYNGLGDLFVIVFFGLVSVMGSAYLQTHEWTRSAALAGLQMGLLATVLIAINNLRDRNEDAQNNKRTLAVRLGTSFVRFEILCLILAPMILMNAWYERGLEGFYLPLLTLPLGLRIAFLIFRTPPGRVYNSFLGQAALLHLIFGITLIVALIV